jgi:uncharacterized protein
MNNLNRSLEMIQEYVYKPGKFFLITYLITWISWFVSAYFSFRPDGQSIYILFMIPGLVAPFGTALWMILTSNNQELKRGFVQKLFNLHLICLSSLPAILLIMPIAVVISILISSLFGYSIDQLNFPIGFSFSVGVVPVLLILVLAASFEELGWRSYAMDSLASKFNYFKATLIFAILWAFWHLPLFFIKDYYQYEILHMNVLYGINFIVSVFPMAFIITWLCRKNNGSILVAILFHFLINFTQEALQMGQPAKCIETLVLIAIAAIIVMANNKLFFEKAKN